MKLTLPAPLTFAVAVVGFAGLAALSYWNRPFAIYALLAWCALAIVATPMVGWALVIFAVPFQDLFAISSDGFGRVRSVLLMILTARLLGLALQRRTYNSSMLWLLLGFAVLVGLHVMVLGLGARELAWESLFFLALAALYIISRKFGAFPKGMALGQAAIVSSALVSAAFAVVFLYGPVPSLIASHQPLEDLRLFGVQDNPNALAKMLLPALLLLACVTIFQPPARRYGIPLLLVAGFALAATGTKSVLIATVATLLLLLPLLNPREARTSRFWVVPTVALLAYAIWLVAVGPWVERHAAQRWIAHHEYKLCYYLEARSSAHGSCNVNPGAATRSEPGLVTVVADAVLRDLRLSGSFAMTKAGEETRYQQRGFRLLEVGQRDRTWEAGIGIVAQHWAWGIGGPKQWAKYMQSMVGYPFSSPHNALLEVTGSYGLLGSLLYLSVVFLFVRNYLRLRHSVRGSWQRIANEWTFLCGMGVFVVELTDTLIVFGIFTIHAMWFWSIAGLQAGLADAAGYQNLADGRGERRQ